MISLPGASAGAVAAAAPPLASAAGTATAGAAADGAAGVFLETSSDGGITNPGSRINALSPRPKAFRAIRYDLLGELEIALRSFTMYVVEHYRLTMTGRFSQSYVPRNYGFIDLRPEKTAKVRSHLLRKCSAIVVHGEKDSLDSKRWIYGAPQPHQGIEQLRYAFEGQVFGLNWDQN